MGLFTKHKKSTNSLNANVKSPVQPQNIAKEVTRKGSESRESASTSISTSKISLNDRNINQKPSQSNLFEGFDGVFVGEEMEKRIPVVQPQPQPRQQPRQQPQPQQPQQHPEKYQPMLGFNPNNFDSEATYYTGTEILPAVSPTYLNEHRMESLLSNFTENNCSVQNSPGPNKINSLIGSIQLTPCLVKNEGFNPECAEVVIIDDDDDDIYEYYKEKTNKEHQEKVIQAKLDEFTSSVAVPQIEVPITDSLVSDIEDSNLNKITQDHAQGTTVVKTVVSDITSMPLSPEKLIRNRKSVHSMASFSETLHSTLPHSNSSLGNDLSLKTGPSAVIESSLRNISPKRTVPPAEAKFSAQARPSSRPITPIFSRKSVIMLRNSASSNNLMNGLPGIPLPFANNKRSSSASPSRLSYIGLQDTNLENQSAIFYPAPIPIQLQLPPLLSKKNINKMTGKSNIDEKKKQVSNMISLPSLKNLNLNSNSADLTFENQLKNRRSLDMFSEMNGRGNKITPTSTSISLQSSSRKLSPEITSTPQLTQHNHTSSQTISVKSSKSDILIEERGRRREVSATMNSTPATASIQPQARRYSTSVSSDHLSTTPNRMNNLNYPQSENRALENGDQDYADIPQLPGSPSSINATINGDNETGVELSVTPGSSSMAENIIATPHSVAQSNFSSLYGYYDYPETVFGAGVDPSMLQRQQQTHYPGVKSSQNLYEPYTYDQTPNRQNSNNHGFTSYDPMQSNTRTPSRQFGYYADGIQPSNDMKPNSLIDEIDNRKADRKAKVRGSSSLSVIDIHDRWNGSNTMVSNMAQSAERIYSNNRAANSNPDITRRLSLMQISDIADHEYNDRVYWQNQYQQRQYNHHSRANSDFTSFNGGPVTMMNEEDSEPLADRRDRLRAQQRYEESNINRNPNHRHRRSVGSIGTAITVVSPSHLSRENAHNLSGYIQNNNSGIYQQPQESMGETLGERRARVQGQNVERNSYYFPRQQEY
ncbi:hypothetical protein NADFUDRAFT_81215 [Nadsonia fulvescens var. elongata DSM 6958]|uniref:Uncharacterized protein n=1 Tax=Nadsonia fulvescens var. elongata DSM 6958 TaxID=857566 RepID=A0A1E3PTM7_9ASCO|nr:hypothetical protein NADFUDRAFT_81215 [Nadsonia fulvescens var. elongata DSM 6958]